MASRLDLAGSAGYVRVTIPLSPVMPPLVCHFCGTPLTVGEPIRRDSECESCRKDLRCCVNCRHYDVRYNNSCTETMADPVEDKDRRNFCEYFYFSREPFATAQGDAARESEARSKLDQLFGGKQPAAGPSQSAREKLEGLFGGPKPAGDRAADAKKKLDGLFGPPKPDREK